MLSANDKVAEARTGRDIDFQIALGALGALTEELFVGGNARFALCLTCAG
jgi:hypothetical protein